MAEGIPPGYDYEHDTLPPRLHLRRVPCRGCGKEMSWLTVAAIVTVADDEGRLHREYACWECVFGHDPKETLGNRK